MIYLRKLRNSSIKIKNRVSRISHTFATRLNEANLNAKAIQAILGHKDIQTTMDIYTEATDILLEEAINTFQIHFKESLPPTAPNTAPKYS